MGSSILGIGQSALAAAQAGLATTGHNIANAATPGYSRQQVVMGTAGSQNYGFGYIGKGTTIVDVKRVYSELLGGQVRTAETSKNQFETYYNQISRINNQLADPAVGLSPVLQDFFKGIQDLAANPNAAASRQAALSSAEALAARFQGLSAEMDEVAVSVNRQIEASVTAINVYAAQIAKLNDAIEKAAGNADGKASNDLLDQRDLALTELSKEIKTTIVKQGNSYSVFIGNGQPLVVGARPYNLVAAASPTDPMRIGVSYAGTGELRPLSEDSLPGGKLGGLFEFRAKSLDIAQNSLGRIAMGMALTFNAQHRLGQDQTGAMGGDFFNMPTTFRAASSSANDTTAAAEIDFTVTNAGALTTSDYRLQRVNGEYLITRLSDKTQVYPTASTADPTVFPSSVEIDGFRLNLASTNPPADGDVFLIRPTATAAASFSVAIKNTLNVAAAAPIRTAASTSNTGTGSISAGTVNGPAPVNPDLKDPITIRFTASNQYELFASSDLTTPLASGTYTAGGNITFNGWTVQVSGAPAAGDTFTVSANDGLGDNRNAVLLGALQSANTLVGGTTSYQGAYAQLVNLVGNKTREVEVTSKAEAKYLEQAITAQQSESGVNLDEEATNLMRYQQAYQAAGKVMQTANQMFEMLLTLGD
ncbi:MAG TPA: flagellar hook-associated protein FlgK [Noviherbaspirillum sp.]|nr:flagellar hook-associated protein FlgK [Noviherbaspirillum sp.]